MAECLARFETFYIEGSEAPDSEDEALLPGVGWPSVTGRQDYILSPVSLTVADPDTGYPNDPGRPYTHARPVIYTASSATQQGTALYGAWTEVRQPVGKETPRLQVTNIDATYYYLTAGSLSLTMWNRACWGNCTTEIFGYSSTWGSRSLGSFSGLTGKVSHARGYYGYTRLWAVIRSTDPDITPFTTAKVVVPASSPQGKIINDVDLAAAVALVASRAIAPEQVCLPLNTLRTPGEGSTSNAFHSCDQTARAAGTAAALRHVAVTYGAAAMAVIMAGTYALPLAPSQSPPLQPAPAPVDDPSSPAVWPGAPEHRMQIIETSLRQRTNASRPIPEDVLKSVARTCYTTATAAGYAPSVACESLPIFLPGSNVFEAARHDARAIAAQPSWMVLTRQTPRTERWYLNVPPCNESYAPRACDEYPFSSALEGGPLARGKPQASLEVINYDDNRNEGSLLSGFFSNCRVPKDGGKFVVIPLVAPTASDRTANPLPTSRVCARSY
ncbi:NucA/NucB deoxyribonuclease domain-containing protein [Cellulomonas sp. NS3]|uniref:NucA/NucB deoxyribonuclease domain-containing protein n=1 Tax=Cellulomonas sp. NS3 TaxID=2973977 RepID=UPI002161DC0C|nr:NucA/NucB deoxyribonuclease domain-containing protein [Cellulomonas sp. NS3]